MFEVSSRLLNAVEIAVVERVGIERVSFSPSNYLSDKASINAAREKLLQDVRTTDTSTQQQFKSKAISSMCNDHGLPLQSVIRCSVNAPSPMTTGGMCCCTRRRIEWNSVWRISNESNTHRWSHRRLIVCCLESTRFAVSRKAMANRSR